MDWFSLQPQHETLGLDGKDHMADAYQSLERDSSEEEKVHQQNAQNLYQHNGYGLSYIRSTRQLLPAGINASNEEHEIS